MEDEALMPVEPGADLGMLVGGVVVEDDVDHFTGRHLGLDRAEEADELLMAMALHVAADDGAVDDVERGKKGRGAMALVVVGHGAEPPLLQRQARPGAVKGLDLAFSHRATTRWHGWRMNRARPRRAVWRRSPDRSRA